MSKRYLSVKEFLKRIEDKKIRKLALFIHNVYEKESKKVGWKTQKNCRVKFDDLPEKNKKVMLKVAEKIIMRFEL